MSGLLLAVVIAEGIAMLGVIVAALLMGKAARRMRIARKLRAHEPLTPREQRLNDRLSKKEERPMGLWDDLEKFRTPETDARAADFLAGCEEDMALGQGCEPFDMPRRRDPSDSREIPLPEVTELGSGRLMLDFSGDHRSEDARWFIRWVKDDGWAAFGDWFDAR